MSNPSRLSLVVLVLSVSLSLTSACATRVPATVTLAPSFPFHKSKSIFVMARHQREVIVQSLKDAGLKTTEDTYQAEYQLTARQGSSRGGSNCGTVRNVSYVLTHEGRRLLIIKGRGKTGQCTDGIYADMSRKLASLARE